MDNIQQKKGTHHSKFSFFSTKSKTTSELWPYQQKSFYKFISEVKKTKKKETSKTFFFVVVVTESK